MNDICKPFRPYGAMNEIRFNSKGCVLRTSPLSKYFTALRALSITYNVRLCTTLTI